jgi:steroid delta-isomerase-like uncharacterized protein
MEAYVEAWNAHDPEKVADFFDLEAVYDDRGMEVVVRGWTEIRDHVAKVLGAFPDLEFEVVRTADGEDFTAGEWAATMTHLGEVDGLRATGRKLDSSGVDLAMLDERGKILHLVSYYDGAAIMRALGLLPSRHSLAERLLVRAASLLPRRS